MPYRTFNKAVFNHLLPVNYSMLLKLIFSVIHEDILSKMEVSSYRRRQDPYLGPSTMVILSFLPGFHVRIFRGKFRKLACKTNEVCMVFQACYCSLREALLS